MLQYVLIKTDLVLIHDGTSAPSTRTALVVLGRCLLLLDLSLDELLVALQVVPSHLLLLLLPALLLLGLFCHFPHVGLVGGYFVFDAPLTLFNLGVETFAHVCQTLLECFLPRVFILLI